MNPFDASVTVGPREALSVRRIRGVRPNWLTPEHSGTGYAQVRAHGEPLPAHWHGDDEGVWVELQQPATGIAPGQGMVLYDGDLVVGSSTITETGRDLAESPESRPADPSLSITG